MIHIPGFGGRVVLHESVRLSVPLIADRDTYDALMDLVGQYGPLAVTQQAFAHGIYPPNDRDGWVVWVERNPADPDRALRLVWYQPDRVETINTMAAWAAKDHPDADEIVIMQGTSWNDLGVMVPGAAGEPASETGPPTAGPAGAAVAGDVGAGS